MRRQQLCEAHPCLVRNINSVDNVKGHATKTRNLMINTKTLSVLNKYVQCSGLPRIPGFCNIKWSKAPKSHFNILLASARNKEENL